MRLRDFVRDLFASPLKALLSERYLRSFLRKDLQSEARPADSVIRTSFELFKNPVLMGNLCR